MQHPGEEGYSHTQHGGTTVLASALAPGNGGNSKTTDTGRLQTGARRPEEHDASLAASSISLGDFLAGGHYKEYEAKRLTASDRACGSLAVMAECEADGNRFGKRLYCGKEWCPRCGEDGSAIHRRRQARCLPKLRQFKVMGYLVIEFLERDRKNKSLAYSRKGMEETYKLVSEVLFGRWDGRKGRVGGFFECGYGRWHWYGDKRPGKWNPHVNVLVNHGYLPKGKLDALKRALCAALGVSQIIAHYKYRAAPGWMMHKIRYVNRSTFRNESWDNYMVGELHRFRNSRWFGPRSAWQNEPAWEIAEVEAEGDMAEAVAFIDPLGSGKCPDCGGGLKGRTGANGEMVYWTSPFPASLLDAWQGVEVAGTGYYRIPRASPFNGDVLTPDEIDRLDRLERCAASGIMDHPDERKATIRRLGRKNVSELMCLLSEREWRRYMNWLGEKEFS